jgi:hypothetical protein
MTSRPLAAPQRIDYRTAPTLIMVKIEAHEGAGVYQAQEVFWSGSAWATITNISRQFGVLYGTAGVRHIAAATDTAVNTIVRAFAFSVNSATGLTDWFFQEGGGGAYDGPFAVTQDPANVNKVIVGANRATNGGDPAIIAPAVVIAAAAQTVTVNNNGWVYVLVTREGVAALGAPAFAVAIPAATTTGYYVPLAYVTFSGGAVTGIFQKQYGNIVVEGTVPATLQLPP